MRLRARHPARSPAAKASSGGAGVSGRTDDFTPETPRRTFMQDACRQIPPFRHDVCDGKKPSLQPDQSSAARMARLILTILLSLSALLSVGKPFTPAAGTERERHAIAHDYPGAPTQAYGGRGKLVWEMLLDVYGNAKEYAGEKCFIPFRYQGQYEDIETCLYYNRFRYYDPYQGNYISQDSIGLEGKNPTLYGYVQDVNTWFDVFGLTKYIVYQAVDLDTGGIYTGRTSGADNMSVEQILKRRKASHHKNLEPLQSVYETDNYKAVRGGEQA